MTGRCAISQAAAARMALALPESHEGAHMGRRDLRVRNRIFATLPEGEARIHLKTTPANLDALVRADPGTYHRIWGERWLGVDLGGVDRAALRELLVEAWRLAAPKSLRAALEAGK